MNNCINCGAPIYSDKDACPYCDTPYRSSAKMSDRFDIDFNLRYQAILKAVSGNCITVNEARRIAGLEEVFK